MTDDAPQPGNSRRKPTVDLSSTDRQLLNSNQPLGGKHVFVDGLEPSPCGVACPHRLASISCPFWRVPCLVGCVVKQVMPGAGFEHEEPQIMVTSQSGKYLIGEEVILNLETPRATHLRIISDKLGNTVLAATPGVTGTLTDLKPAITLPHVEYTEQEITGENDA